MTNSPISFNPGELHQLYHGVSVPDPITFVVSPEFLNRRNLYPRQATLLKVIFLRDDLFTTYDHEVIDEWIENYRLTGNNGISPDIYERIKILKANGHKWFREVLEVMGRRAGKGYLGSLAMTYVLWNYMAKGDPQNHYGIDRSKQLTALIFGVNKDLAKKNLWKDFVDVVTDSECFAPYIESDQEESLSIYAPNDFVKMRKMEQRNIAKKKKKATFQILPKEGSKAGPRGFAAFINGWDEMAHVSASAGSKSDAAEVYDAAAPALDQFKRDAFSIMPSSPWSKEGKFYELYEQCLEQEDDGTPVYASKMFIQLASWDIYLDWERAGYLNLFPPGYEGDLGEYKDKPEPKFAPLKLAIQDYDDEMRKEERANPEKFKVERRAHFATALDAYLDERKVAQAFRPWEERAHGDPVITSTYRGPLSIDYIGHIDPANVNDRMGIALGHVEYAKDDDLPHVVFDLIHAFDPADYEEHTIDYPEVVDWIYDSIVVPFCPIRLTHDQFNGPYMRQTLYKKINEKPMPKHVWIHEVTATAATNWTIAETFKAALNLGLVHFPDDTEPCTWARQEMLFLQEPRPGRVDHPDSGPVTTKDIWDAIAHVVYHLIGERLLDYLGKLQETGGVGLPGGIDPQERFNPENINRSDPMYQKLSAAGKRASRGRFGAAPRQPGSLGYGRARGRH